MCWKKQILVRVYIRNKDPRTRLIRARLPNVIELPSVKAYVSIPRYPYGSIPEEIPSLVPERNEENLRKSRK